MTFTDFEARKTALWEILQETAAAGERCPTKDGLDRALELRGLPPYSGEIPRELVRDGKIKIEISGRNWRTVEILKGPNAGKRTAENPDGRPAHRVLDYKGEHYPKRAVGASRRRA